MSQATVAFFQGSLYRSSHYGALCFVPADLAGDPEGVR